MPPWKRAPRRVRPPTPAQQGRVVTPAHAPVLSLRDEKILLTLVVQTQQINDRLTRLEDRFEASIRDAIDQPDQQDLLELRLHSARLAAELSRVTIELRAEINEIAAASSGATGADDIVPPHRHEPDAAEPEPPVSTIDLRETPERSRSVRASGWRPAPAPKRAPER